MASAFTPHFFLSPDRARLGCGATALAALTGVEPELIAFENGARHYPDRFMVRFLRAHGFRTLRLSRSVLVDKGYGLGFEHVLLVSQQLTREEGTWGIIFGDTYVHNFETYRLSTFWLLRKPLMSAYVIFHPRWRTGLDAGLALTRA